MSAEIEVIIHLPVELKHEKNAVISHCPILDVYSQGDDDESAIENIKEAVKLFIISCYERGVLDNVLKECGFTPYPPAKSRKTKKGTEISIPVPLYLLNHGSYKPQSCPA